MTVKISIIKKFSKLILSKNIYNLKNNLNFIMFKPRKRRNRSKKLKPNLLIQKSNQ